MMAISIIIPTLNSPLLERTLQSLVTQILPDDEILVVGLDETGVTQRFLQVRFISTLIPVGAAAARNLGMREAKRDVFLFTDSDCIPSPVWVETHRKYQQEGYLVVGGAVEIHQSNYWSRADNLSMFHHFSVGHPSGTRFLLPTLNLSLQRSVFEMIGGMDETFLTAGGEDSDWTIRMRQAGYTLHFISSIVVTHCTSRDNWRAVFNHWYRSGYYNIRVRLRYPIEFGTPSWASHSILLKILAPLIAAWITFKIYTFSKGRLYWECLPIVYATKIIYCWGAASAVEMKS